MHGEIVELIQATLRDLGDDGTLKIGEVGPDTVLFGDGGILDSMGLVSLVIALEQEIEDKFGKSIGLADEKAMSQANSPYRSIESLAGYAASEMESA